MATQDSSAKPTKSGKRTRRTGAAADVLKKIEANKAKRDAEKNAREAKEQAAFERYADMVGEAAKKRAALDKKIDALREKETKLRGEISELERRYEGEQGRALFELQELGNSAERVGDLVGLSAKRVRALIKLVTDSPKRTGVSAKLAEPSVTGAAKTSRSAAEKSESEPGTETSAAATNGAASSADTANKSSEAPSVV